MELMEEYRVLDRLKKAFKSKILTWYFGVTQW
jgi:hypothetical protein